MFLPESRLMELFPTSQLLFKDLCINRCLSNRAKTHLLNPFYPECSFCCNLSSSLVVYQISSMSSMSSRRDYIAQITAAKEAWNIVARVVRIWFVPSYNDPNVPFSMEMVLMDEKGDRIQASVRRTLIYKFQRDLKEGLVYSMSFLTLTPNTGGAFITARHQYKLKFEYGSRVLLVAGNEISGSIYNLVSIDDILNKDLDVNYLVDVIGLLTGVGNEREYFRNGSKTKMNVIELDNDGFKIECALFGNYVDELNAFLASGDVNNAIVIVQFAKVKTFQGKIGLQNTLSTTSVIFNADCTDAIEFKKRMCATDSPLQGLSQLQDTPRVCVEDDFLVLTPRKTIHELKKLKRDCCCIVLATVIDVHGEDWWYTSCSCSRSVYPDAKLYFCDKCNKHILHVIPRYRIKVKVVDDTSLTTFVIFDRDATYLMNKTCSEMIETFAKDSSSSVVPQEIAALVDKTFLFKVEFKYGVNSRFEESFSVKKICSDDAVVQKFKELSPSSVGIVHEDDGMTALSTGVVVQNLMPKFTNVVGKEFEGDNGVSYDLTRDTDDLTPAKRSSEEECDTSADSGSVKHLKKNIKVEKA